MTVRSSRGIARWRYWLSCGILLLAGGALVLGGCRPSADPDETAAQVPTPGPSASAERPSLEPIGQYCQDWLQALQPINHEALNYTAVGGQWDGTLGSPESCDIQMRDAPAAAAADLDFVWVKLALHSMENAVPNGNGLTELADPSAPGVDWDMYLENEGHTPLAGDLECAPIWDSADEYVTDDDLAECDRGDEIDGQRFMYEFRAVHRNVMLLASVDYYTTDISESVEQGARDHAIELYASFAAEAARAL